MKRITKKKSSKRAITLVELVVAMALTAIFAATCVMLIYPVIRIYTHVNDLSRAQVVADTVIDSIRTECARTYITESGDVWITNTGNSLSMSQSAPGHVLVIRRSNEYCETIGANYAIDNNLYSAVRSAEENEPQTNPNSITSRAVYRLFDENGTATTPDVADGYVHFGYFKFERSEEGYCSPSGYYDFTNPIIYAAYDGFTVTLNFHDIKYASESEGGLPLYVLCDVTVLRNTSVVHSRKNVVLCFATPVI